MNYGLLLMVNISHGRQRIRIGQVIIVHPWSSSAVVVVSAQGLPI